MKGKIVRNNDFSKIMKVANCEDGYCYGYDAISEQFTRLSKHDCYEVNSGEPIFKSLRDPQVSLRIADLFFDFEKEKAEFLGVTVRTIYRLRDKQNV